MVFHVKQNVFHRLLIEISILQVQDLAFQEAVFRIEYVMVFHVKQNVFRHDTLKYGVNERESHTLFERGPWARYGFSFRKWWKP